MSTFMLSVAAVAIVPAFGLAAWLWLVSAGVNDELRTFAGFEGMHFER